MTDIKKDTEELLAKAKAERLAMSKKPESKGAGSATSAEKEKTKGTESEVEKKAREEAELLAKEDKDLDDNGKKKKADIIKAKAEAKSKEEDDLLKAKDEDLDDDKKKRKAEIVNVREKSGVQKRIDELSGKIKFLESDANPDKAEIKALRDKLSAIEKERAQTPDSKIKDKIKKELSDRVVKYLEEDKKLPRSERREMTKEELDEWLTEDYSEATDWIAGRRIRRFREEEILKRDEFLNVKASESMDNFNKGYVRIISKHPELDITKRRAELEKEGKSKPEIRNIIASENPKWKAFMEIFEGNMSKYLEAEDGPSKIAEEMEKRLTKEPEKNSEIEDLRKQVADLAKRLAEKEELDDLDTDVSSTRHPEPKGSKTELDQQQEKLAKEVGLDLTKLNKRKDYRKANVR